jgi:hypothetical protein
VDLPTVVYLLSTIIIIMKSAYLEELLETFIFYFFNIEYFDWIVSMGSTTLKCITFTAKKMTLVQVFELVILVSFNLISTQPSPVQII